MDKFDTAAALRQQILDFANERGLIETVVVSKQFGINIDHANRCLRKMVANGELKREGRQGARILHSPLATVTTPANVIRAKAYNRQQEMQAYRREQERKKNAPSEPWRYVNDPEDRGPGKISGIYKNQGGQGAIRREFGIQASAGML